MPTCREYMLVTPQDLGGRSAYRAFLRNTGLPADAPDGWGLLCCVADDGQRVTLATRDVDYVRMIAAAHDAGVLAGLAMPAGKVDLSRRGWPNDWITGC